MKKQERKLIITGYAKSGKDTLCDMLVKQGHSFKSSSDFVNERAVYPVLKEVYGYKSPEECFADRINHREEWFNLIYNYNSADPAKLGRELFKEYSIYCGLRNIIEFEALVKEFNPLTIWIDATKRLGKTETIHSITIRPEDCDIVINNNKSLEHLEILAEYIFL